MGESHVSDRLGIQPEAPAERSGIPVLEEDVRQPDPVGDGGQQVGRLKHLQYARPKPTLKSVLLDGDQHTGFLN